LKLSQILREANEAQEQQFDRWQPEAGQSYVVKVVDVRSKEKDGLPRWSLWLEVQSGPDEGKRFWTTLFITANAGVNKRVISALQAFGLTEAFLASDPTTDLVGSALEGSSVRVTAGYREDKKRKNDDGTPVLWDNHTFETLDVPDVSDTVVVDDDDDDDSW
jgi:hypothetical protein